MNQWLSPTLVRDLGWTLVHFLWEGLAIAGLLAAGLRLFKSSAARFKYLAGCAALALMALAPLTTFVFVARQNGSPTVSSVPVNSGWLETAVPALPALVVTATRDARAASFSQELEMLFPWLVLGWVAGVCALSGRLLAGWFQVRRLRFQSTEPLSWTEPFIALARRLGVSHPVRLLQSALVEVPTVIGWLRPVILLPVSCVTGLAPRQLESIIAHELAHIRRHDYLINLLQSAVETLLFYHPAVWWVSRRIRDEREHCCDDLAVEVCGDRVGYARALATLEELRPASAQLALAAAGAPLLQRIRRLAGQPDRSAGRASWPVAGITLLLVLGILAAGIREHRAAAQDVDHAVPGPVLAAGRPAPHDFGTHPPEVNIKAKFVEITTQPGETNTIFNFGAQGTMGPVTGILTDPQFRATISALGRRDGANLLTSPEVTTESGRQAQIQVGDAQAIVVPGKGTNTSTTNMFFGETLDVIATISPDKRSVSMTLIPSVSEFLGYVKVSTNSTVLPLPRFQLRQTTANVTVLDAQTVVIGGFMTDGTNANSQAVKKELLIFVTATIINPDGTRYHSEEEMKAPLAGPPPAQGSTNQ